MRRLARQPGLNWAWPPGRRMNRTRPRATSSARCATKVLLDQRAGQIDPGGHARRGVDVAVAHEDRVGLHVDRRVVRAQAQSQATQCVVARRPSSSPARASRNAPVHTELTRRERRAASRNQLTQALVPGRRHARPGHRATIKRVDRPGGRRPGCPSGSAEAARAGDRPPIAGNELERVGPAIGGPIGEREHLRRPGDVEALDVGKRDDDDAAGSGMSRSCRSRDLAAMTSTGRFLP